MQTQITNAANVDALAALFTYTITDGVQSRPLGEFPVKSQSMAFLLGGANSASGGYDIDNSLGLMAVMTDLQKLQEHHQIIKFGL